MNVIDKYVREIYGVATQIGHVVDAAQSDSCLSQEQREDLSLELSRLKTVATDCIAALVELSANIEES